MCVARQQQQCTRLHYLTLHLPTMGPDILWITVWNHFKSYGAIKKGNAQNSGKTTNIVYTKKWTNCIYLQSPFAKKDLFENSKTFQKINLKINLFYRTPAIIPSACIFLQSFFHKIFTLCKVSIKKQLWWLP